MALFLYLRTFLAAVGAVGVALLVVTAIEYFIPTLSFEQPIVRETMVEQIKMLETDPVVRERSVPVVSLEKTEEGKVTTPPKPFMSKESASAKPVKTQKSARSVSTTSSEWEVSRVENPYGVPPRSFADINTEARAALVNIFCQPNSSLSPVTASGVIVSPSGVIVTNAHVAQYVLLAQSEKVNLHCVVRTGAPARERWVPRVLYVPPEWVREHARELTDANALGTGEHDWALLYVASSTDGSTLPNPFPFLPPDARGAIGFMGDTVLSASYPAGFLGGMSASMNLYPASALTTIQTLMTFSSGSPDIFSIGGTVTAQSGSSGGAVVNAWGYVIGLITTMKDAKTTSERDLRALTLSYIDADLKAHTRNNLLVTTSGNLAPKAAVFMATEGDVLMQLLIDQLDK